MSSATLIPPQERSACHGQPEGRPTYGCECGHVLRSFGGGRHRVYFELSDPRSEDPVMNSVCPACGHGLPGKNHPNRT
jgi:hypothetical protein